MLFLRLKGDRVYSCSGFNPIYFASFIFVICLFAGLNTNFDQFEKVSRLPLQKNETSFIKSINFNQEENIFHFIINFNNIFQITLDSFLESFNIAVKSDSFILKLTQNDFYDHQLTKNKFYFNFIIPVSTNKPVRVILMYKDIEFYQKVVIVNSLKSVMTDLTYYYDFDNYSEFYDVCAINGRLNMYFSHDFTYLHRFNNIFDNKKNTTRSNVVEELKIPTFESMTNIFFADDEIIKTIHNSVMPIVDLISKGVNNIHFIYNKYSPLIPIVQSLNPGIKTIKNTDSLCYKAARITKTEISDITPLRNLLNIKEKGEDVVIISSDVYQNITNLVDYLSNEFKDSNFVFIDENTNINEYRESLANAKAVIVGDGLGVYSMIGIPSKSTVYRIISSKDDIINNDETTLAMEVDVILKYILLNDVNGEKRIVY